MFEEQKYLTPFGSGLRSNYLIDDAALICHVQCLFIVAVDGY